MDEHAQMDDTLSQIDASLRAGDPNAAFDLYLAFDALLTRYVRGEERLLFPVLERFTSMPSPGRHPVTGCRRRVIP